MRFFLHTLTKIRIINGDQEWNGTPADFAALEPDYPGLPELTPFPAVIRSQTADLKYIEDSAGHRHADAFDALIYCDHLAQYAPMIPAIYVHVTLSKTLLSASDPSDYISFQAAIRSGPAADAPVIPLDATWPIMLRQKNGLAMENILTTFTQGVYLANYTYSAALPLGEWYIDEQDFTAVTVGAVTYQVKLAAPVRFTVYRSL